MIQEQFSNLLLAWFDLHGRKDLPWQHPRSAYRVWISEIMLQQTQVKTVIPYFNRFIDSFPDVWQLAKASEDQVLAHWSGLGYYSRARNLSQTAKIICEKYAGEFPLALVDLVALPGIGPSTAAAIASQAFNQPTAILDGNVKRVLCRYFLIEGWPEQSAIKQRLWQLANQCMPRQRCADYTQAIMDLGATCCTVRQPNCASCPIQKTCLANIHHKTAFYPQKN
ncbi:A/G-specific adenine glycosylase [Legionella tunisiensis]|uniref:A/G-specific adenine glycosylase n=1 Tax=Legionella tunisiensis TaxID=1034944 RepID=UPI000300EAE2|nr:A/G-specific adenine glycosylase [Legionella tunisiensis]